MHPQLVQTIEHGLCASKRIKCDVIALTFIWLLNSGDAEFVDDVVARDERVTAPVRGRLCCVTFDGPDANALFGLFTMRPLLVV